MIVGVPSEVKPAERRVSVTPFGVAALIAAGHDVLVQAGAGAGAGYEDEHYAEHGAELLDEAADVFAQAELVAKVKEPLDEEVELLRPSQILFTYLHLAADPGLALALCESGATCIAYETVRDEAGRLPLLAPMSEIAGKLAVQAGATALESPSGGRGVLIGGSIGVPPGNVVVVGAGVAGANAASVAWGMGARVRVFDRDPARLESLEDRFFGAGLDTAYAEPVALADAIADADVVVGTVHVRGARTPRVVESAAVARMRPGSVIVDVSIDQGGCCETSRPTTHDDPVFTAEGVVHYCVTNMPGVVPVTATAALTNATLPRLLRLAAGGVPAALEDSELRSGLNIHAGEVTNDEVAKTAGVRPIEGALASV